MLLFSILTNFLALGQTLHEVVARLKSEPSTYPHLSISSSQSDPINEPILISLPSNGLRLQFDGPLQQLRLIEVIDFSKVKLTYKSLDLGRQSPSFSPPHSPHSTSSDGPNFKHIYSKLFGPTFPGLYKPADEQRGEQYGTYILSYPGLAFTFPLLASAWHPNKDFATILSLPACKPASSLAVFHGASWTATCPTLFTAQLSDPKLGGSGNRDSYPDEVAGITVFGGGKVKIEKSYGREPFWLYLGQTTAQDCVAELGPPDAVYRKSDQRLSIHKADGAVRPTTRASDDPSFDHSTAITTDDDSDSPVGTATPSSSDQEGSDEDYEEVPFSNLDEPITGRCFYNYFYHGLDILFAPPPTPSPAPPGFDSAAPEPEILNTSAPLVATKLILHSNVPGTYSFNRHRRVPWSIGYLPPPLNEATSQLPFSTIASSLHSIWSNTSTSTSLRGGAVGAGGLGTSRYAKGMVLNRDWGDSPGSSVELLGGWEEQKRTGLRGGYGGRREGSDESGGSEEIEGEGGNVGNTTLFGWPGLVVEVAGVGRRGGEVGEVTVF